MYFLGPYIHNQHITKISWNLLCTLNKPFPIIQLNTYYLVIFKTATKLCMQRSNFYGKLHIPQGMSTNSSTIFGAIFMQQVFPMHFYYKNQVQGQICHLTASARATKLYVIYQFCYIQLCYNLEICTELLPNIYRNLYF